MKTTITRQMLKKALSKRNAFGRNALIFLGIFALICVVIIPNRIVGFAAAAVLIAIAVGLWFKTREPGVGDVGSVVFRLRAVTDKQTIDTPDENGNAFSSTPVLCFGESASVEVTAAEYERAAIGSLYYVAYDPQTDTPVACYSADLYEVGPEFRIMQ